MLHMWARLVLMDYRAWVVMYTGHVVYLARYAPGLGRNSCGVPVSRWPLSRILTYVKLTSDIVSRENTAGKSPGSSR